MLRNYLLTAYKVFLRRKLFTAINLFCIVLTLVVLMVVTALADSQLRPSGAEHRSARMLQVLMIEMHSPDGGNISRSPIGYKIIEQYLKPMQSVERVGATTHTNTVAVYQQGRVTELAMRRADAGYWRILDFKLLAGRLPNEDDDTHGRFVAVINQATSAKLFGVASAIGQSISTNGQQFRIIGVVDNEMSMNAYADLWVPISTFPTSEYRQQMTGGFTALLLARSEDDLPMIRKDVETISKSVQFDDPTLWNQAFFFADSKLDTVARLTVGNNTSRDSGADALLMLALGLMLVFMLLPAINLVNLNSGRILERSAEIGVRKAFGATSAQLVTQLIVENLLLCLFGGVLGLLCTAAVLAWLEMSGLIPYLKVSINLAVLGYGFLITMLFGLLSGALPALKMSRLDPVHALKGAV